MRSIRFHRGRLAGIPKLFRKGQPGDPGLHDFRSETAAAGEGRSRRVLMVVAGVALLEAVPAGLWLHQAFVRPDAPVALAQPVSAAVLPASPVPSCEAGPAPVATVAARAATPAPKGTSGPSPAPAPRSVGGLITVTTPVAMRIYNGDRIVGTTEAETVMLPVGTHTLSFVSDEAGYTARRTVTVQAGRTTKVVLEAPSGSVNVNAAPWAEVWVDNQRVGETPIANLQLPIGPREFVFRHPELGERRKTAIVTLKQPVRVSMDMRTR